MSVRHNRVAKLENSKKSVNRHVMTLAEEDARFLEYGLTREDIISSYRSIPEFWYRCMLGNTGIDSIDAEKSKFKHEPSDDPLGKYLAMLKM